ncbi:MAG: phosphatase PAP2 family protein [Acidobacteriaceae bacterium]|nr:phosphatase PAP2 family protein [Acidobacteriaceae bacterium]
MLQRLILVGSNCPEPIILRRSRKALVPLITLALALLMISHPVLGQTLSTLEPLHFLDGPVQALNLEGLNFAGGSVAETSEASDDPGDPNQPKAQGLARRGIKRVLRDQKELYRAPFQRSSFKWDAIVLAGTGALLATDRRIESHLPGGNVDIYTNISNVALGGTAGALALFWGYGIKTHNEHLKEMGSLEVEALVNTFLIYTPMQFIAGRDRPGEGNGYGDFWKHHNINTSFPAGHPMFTIVMASVVAHEYPKPWVEALAYGAAAAVMGGRLLGRDHWASDVFVGSALGYFIGSRIFHLHCNPKFSEACHSH